MKRFIIFFFVSVLFGGGGLLGAVGGNVLGSTKPFVEPIAFSCGGARGGDIDGDGRGRLAALDFGLERRDFVISRLYFENCLNYNVKCCCFEFFTFNLSAIAFSSAARRSRTSDFCLD